MCCVDQLNSQPRAEVEVVRAEANLAAAFDRVAQVADVRAHAGESLESKAPRDELEDRGRVVEGVIDIVLLRHWPEADRRDTRAWPPPVAVGRWHLVPEAAVLVVGHDDQRRRPCGARLDLPEQLGDVHVTAEYVGVTRVLIVAA